MMKVSKSLDNLNITAAEINIVDMLCKSIQTDIGKISCPHCLKESEVILHVDKTKMSVLRPEILACCPEFGKEIEKALSEVA
jgi:uncharacterized protein (UPF0212 family)